MSVKIVSNIQATDIVTDEIVLRKGAYQGQQPVSQVVYDIPSHDGRSSYTFDHYFDSADLYVQVFYEKSANIYERVFPGIELTLTTVKVLFATASIGSKYKIIVIG
jgi:hypothetical protein